MNRLLVEAVERMLNTDKHNHELGYLGPHQSTGFPLFASAGVITTEDVRSLEDEE